MDNLSSTQKDTCNTLKSMGFDENICVNAALIFGSDINGAVAYLTNDIPIMFDNINDVNNDTNIIKNNDGNSNDSNKSINNNKIKNNNNDSNNNDDINEMEYYMNNKKNMSLDDIYMNDFMLDLGDEMSEIIIKQKKKEKKKLRQNNNNNNKNSIQKREMKSEFNDMNINNNNNNNNNIPLTKEEELKLNETNKLITSKISDINISEDDILNEFIVHKATWFGDVLSLKNYDIKFLNMLDNNGNTPLSLSIRLGYDNVSHHLLSMGCDPRIVLPCGWNIIQESVLNNDHRLVRDLMIHEIQLRSSEYEMRKKIILNKLNKMKNFKLEISWKVQSSLAVLNNLINKFAKIDNFKIWKQNNCIRFDMFMRGFSANGVQKGHVSFLFTENGIINIDHDTQTWTNAIRKYKNPDFDEMEREIRIMMKTEQGRAVMVTNNVKFNRKKDWLKRDKIETIDGYECDVIGTSGLNYTIIEHKNKKNNNNNNDDWKHPTFDEYFNENKNKNKKNKKKLSVFPNYIKKKVQPIDVTIWMAKQHPLNDDDISIVLEAISIASEDMRKLADIFKLKFPNGFPVQLNLPIVVGISASATFCNFNFCENDEDLFKIPNNYRMI